MGRIYVHGLGQPPGSWEGTLLRLGADNGSVCPNLAALPRSGKVSYPELYAAFAEFCSAFDGPIDFCGLSLGGVLALHYTAEHPGMVRSLALIATPYKMPKALLRFQNLLFRLLPASAFGETGFGKAGFLSLCGSMADLDFSGSLHKITCPSLVVCGGKDSANRKASAALANALPNAEFRVIRGSGHEVNTDAPEQLAAVLAAFYRRLPQPPTV